MAEESAGPPAATPGSLESYRYRATIVNIESARRQLFRVDLGFSVYRSILADLHGLPGDASIPRAAVVDWYATACEQYEEAWPLTIETVRHEQDDDPYFTAVVARKSDGDVLNQRLYNDFIDP